jgi:hypothetical protein
MPAGVLHRIAKMVEEMVWALNKITNGGSLIMCRGRQQELV